MPTINKKITINASLDAVFDFIIKPSNLPQVWTSLIKIENEHHLPDGGYSFDWQYRMGGIVLSGSGRHTNVVPNRWLVCETKSAVNSKITWTVRSTGINTRLFFTIDYRIPIPVLGWMAEKTIIRMNESETESLLANIKAKLETDYRPVRENHYSFVKAFEGN